MKCKTCKYWGNINNVVGHCRLFVKIDKTEAVSIHYPEHPLTPKEIIEYTTTEQYADTHIATGKNFGCNNWIPEVKVHVSTTDGDINLYGDNL